MDDRAVIERLRSDLRAQSEATATPDWLVDAGRRRWRRRRARRAGAGAVLAAVVLVGAGAVAASRGDDSGTVDTGPADPPSVETSTPSSPSTLSTTAPTIPPPTVATIPAGPPSQSTEDALRDGVAPVLAAVPLAGRAEVGASVETPEGRWLIAEPTLALQQQRTDSCTLGDETGVFGVDWICVGSYGEVLLLAPDGTVAEAYPMAEVNPSWLHVTPDAVIGGRVGDGGQPFSSLFRIDRTTLELQGLIFPSPDGTVPEIGGSYMVPTTADSWDHAPAGAAIDALVHSGGPGTEVTSAIGGDLHVDLAGVEALFAGG